VLPRRLLLPSESPRELPFLVLQGAPRRWDPPAPGSRSFGSAIVSPFAQNVGSSAMIEGHGGPPDQGTVRPPNDGDLAGVVIGVATFGLLVSGVGAELPSCPSSLDELAT
jgi:hypothetical protein